MTLSVLGVDPGKQTGVVLLQIGPQAPFTVTTHRLMHAAVFGGWLRKRLETSVINLVAIETWQHFAGQRGVKGAAQAAYAAGRVRGAVEGAGIDGDRIIEVKRSDVLSGLGLSSNASKAKCAAAVRQLVAIGAATDHEFDAAAVGIVGANRWQSIEALA